MQLDLAPSYEVVTAPSLAVLTVEDLQAQLRIDADDEADLIETYIEAATQLVESDARLYLRPATLTLHLDSFPAWPRLGGCGQAAQRPAVQIGRGPVTDVTAVRYVDAAGDEQTWDPAEYRVHLAGLPARIEPGLEFGWPVIRRQPGAVQIDFGAGYAEGGAPAIALQMIRLLVGHWFEHREAAGMVSREIAFSYSALLERLAWE